jgi:hypothetical protein
MRQPTVEWSSLQNQLASCTLCKAQFPKIPVDCPPGYLYPPPPQPVKILFVGVAPPEKGKHFFNQNHADNLRNGLFAVLKKSGWPCNDLKDFLRHGFFGPHSQVCQERDHKAIAARLSFLFFSLSQEGNRIVIA